MYVAKERPTSNISSWQQQLCNSSTETKDNSLRDEGSFSTENTGEEVHEEKKQQQPQNHPHGTSSGVSNSKSSTNQQQQATKKRRNLPGTPGKYSTLSFTFSLAHII
ncbi:hypothetical protein CR513_57850, partial [Mucuna pruriens]